MSSQAELEAFTPLGSSVAGAIICASLFFVAGVLSLGYYFYTSKKTFLPGWVVKLLNLSKIARSHVLLKVSVFTRICSAEYPWYDVIIIACWCK